MKKESLFFPLFFLLLVLLARAAPNVKISSTFKKKQTETVNEIVLDQRSPGSQSQKNDISEQQKVLPEEKTLENELIIERIETED